MTDWCARNFVFYIIKTFDTLIKCIPIFSYVTSCISRVVIMCVNTSVMTRAHATNRNARRAKFWEERRLFHVRTSTFRRGTAVWRVWNFGRRRQLSEARVVQCSTFALRTSRLSLQTAACSTWRQRRATLSAGLDPLSNDSPPLVDFSAQESRSDVKQNAFESSECFALDDGASVSMLTISLALSVDIVEWNFTSFCTRLVNQRFLPTIF